MSDQDVTDNEDGIGAHTLTRAELAEAVYREVGLSRNESAELVELVLEKMITELVAGNPVKISSFGSFAVREKKERIGRNPKTGEEAVITPRRVLVFKASQQLKARVNNPDIDISKLEAAGSGDDL